MGTVSTESTMAGELPKKWILRASFGVTEHIAMMLPHESVIQLVICEFRSRFKDNKLFSGRNDLVV